MVLRYKQQRRNNIYREATLPEQFMMAPPQNFACRETVPLRQQENDTKPRKQRSYRCDAAMDKYAAGVQASSHAAFRQSGQRPNASLDAAAASIASRKITRQKRRIARQRCDACEVVSSQTRDKEAIQT